MLIKNHRQRAIASRPTTAVRAYILGGLAWFAIPFGFATTLGLAAQALTDNPKFPTYPLSPSPSDISAGLASSFAAITLLGKNGAVALLITLFMAVTSCASAELIAVSSILTFDIYKTYIKPHAAPHQMIRMAHINVCVFGLTMAIFACIWNIIGIDLGWLFLVMGLLIGGAVFPAAFAITWRKQSNAGAIGGALVGLVVGIAAWLAEAKSYYGVLTVSTTGMEYPTLAGNLAAILTGLIVSVTVSYIKPDNFDWAVTRAIGSENMGVQPSSENSSQPTLAPEAGSKDEKDEKAAGKDDNAVNATDARRNSEIIRDEEKQAAFDAALEEEPSKLRSAFKLACVTAFVLTFLMDFLIPIPMFLSHFVFSLHFFEAWVIISFIWVFSSAAISVVLPIWETRGFFKEFERAIWGDMTKKSGK